MAARRLVIVMIVLLVVSSIAAALAPVRNDEPTEEPRSEAQPLGAEQPSRGRLVRAQVTVDDRVDTVRAAVGDQLQLRMSSRRPLTLELPRLGLSEDAGPGAPAFFDVLLTEPGRFEARLLGRKEVVARILVADEGKPRR